ncbi:hypothetical protein GCM10027456_51750 [Kineosporia babensis]
MWEALSDPKSIASISGFVFLLLTFGVPLQCNHPKGPAPFRGCWFWVYGFAGSCQHHGRPVGSRIMGLLGGKSLIARRQCDRCGYPRVYARHRDSGRSYLGCMHHPNCKNPRLLGNYTL